MFRPRTILHPTDFSERSDAAFRLAWSLARESGARLILLHVTPPPLVHYPLGTVYPPEDQRPLLEEELRRLRLPDATVAVERRLEEGDAAAEILRVAQETHCDLIALGTHGRTGLGRVLMGSVAEQVVRRASCPVLTVKTPFSTAA